MTEFEESGHNWTVDLAPCDPKVRLRFGNVEGELHYNNAEKLSSALLRAIDASKAHYADPENFPKIRREEKSKKPRCRLFHNWSKWGSRTVFNMLAVYTDGAKVPCQEVRQARICDRCGKIQERKVR